MSTRAERLLRYAVVFLAAAGCLTAGVLGLHAYRGMTVRQRNAYAMQSAGQLIVEHLRLHSGAWPRCWAELRDTCATTSTRILGAEADAEIEELKRLVEVDWTTDTERLRRSPEPLVVVRLQNRRKDSFVGAEPNQMIWEYLRQTNRTSVSAGAGH